MRRRRQALSPWAQCLAGSADTPIKLPQELIDLVKQDSAKGINGTRLVQLAHEDEVAAAAGQPPQQPTTHQPTTHQRWPALVAPCC